MEEQSCGSALAAKIVKWDSAAAAPPSNPDPGRPPGPFRKSHRPVMAVTDAVQPEVILVTAN